MTATSAIAKPSLTDRAQRVAGKVKLGATLVIAIAALVLARDLPLQEAMQAALTWVEGLGPWGIAVFAAIYALATVAFVPGLVLTLAAGAIFGLAAGFVAVSAGSTAGAGLAFLVARYLARRRVARLAAASPRFAAIDAAIAEGGWKIVALLRLSPAVPFNLQNYLFGLTRVRFWSYLVTSWLAMMPGTFLYVYVGHLTGSAVGGARQRTAGEWVLLGVGLAATVAVTWYVTRLARRQLAARTAAGAPSVESAPATERPLPSRRWPWSATVAVALALLLAALATLSCRNPGRLRAALPFGPPAAELSESHARRPHGPRFDHSAFDRLLRRHVDADGWIDYRGFARDREALHLYLAAVAAAPFDELGRDEKLALLINAYNAATIELILDHGVPASIRDIAAARRWKAERWTVAGKTLSLDQIEHREIRPHFAEPRIHFALVCAAVGCPPLRPEAFTGERLEQQLVEQTRYVHAHSTWVRWDPARRTLHLTPLYQWYGGDFEQVAGSVPVFVARHLPGLERPESVRVRWLDYDWALNDVANRRPR